MAEAQRRGAGCWLVAAAAAAAAAAVGAAGALRAAGRRNRGWAGGLRDLSLLQAGGEPQRLHFRCQARLRLRWRPRSLF